MVFEIVNGSAETFLHPRPLAPTAVVLHWSTEDGSPTGFTEETALLPIALGPGQTLPVHLDLVQAPEPGRYRVTLARAEDPTRILGKATVTVR